MVYYIVDKIKERLAKWRTPNEKELKGMLQLKHPIS